MAIGTASTNSPVLSEQQLEQYEGFILRTASLTLHRVIGKSDDEWSIALSAFAEAVKGYVPERGSFEAYARRVIAHRLIDEVRSRRKYQAEYPVAPVMFTGDAEENAPLQRYLIRDAQTPDENALAEEIEGLSVILSDYGFGFQDLPACSPRAAKTRAECLRVVRYMASEPLLLRNLRQNKRLPCAALECGVPVNRKMLDRYRKYIIAAVEICCGDFPGLRSYLSGGGK